MNKKYGLDKYSRYVEYDGERYLIEPYPYLRDPFDLWYKARARFDMGKWWISKQTGWNWQND